MSVDRVTFLGLIFLLVGMLPVCDNFSFCLILLFIFHFISLDADDNLGNLESVHYKQATLIVNIKAYRMASQWKLFQRRKGNIGISAASGDPVPDSCPSRMFIKGIVF